MTNSELTTSNKRSQIKVVSIIWILITMILAFMTVFPLLFMFSISAKPSAEVFQSNLIPDKPTFDNFIYVFTEVPFWRYMINTFFVSSVVTIAALFFHTMAGYALARLRFRGRDFIFLAMFSTFLVSLPVIIVPLYIWCGAWACWIHMPG